MGAFWNNLFQQLGSRAVLTIIAGIVGFFCWVLASREQQADIKDLLRTEIASVKEQINIENSNTKSKLAILKSHIVKLEQYIKYLETNAVKIDNVKDDLASLKKDIAVMQVKYEKQWR